MKERMDYGHILRLLARNFSFMGKSIPLFIFGGILSFGNLALSFLIPYLYQQLIRMANTSSLTEREMAKLIYIPFGVLILLAPIVCIGKYWQKESAYLATAKMQKVMCKQILYSNAKEMDCADKLIRATHNVKDAARIMSGIITTHLFMFFISFFGTLIMLLIINWYFALIGVVLSAVVFTLSTMLNTRLRKLEQRAQEAESRASSRLIEIITNLPMVKLLLLESKLTQRFREEGAIANNNRLHYNRYRGVTDGMTDFLTYGAQPAIILIGSIVFTETNFANLVYIAGLMDVMMSGTRNLCLFVQYIQRNIVSSQRMYELLDMPTESDRLSSQSINIHNEWAIEFDKVSFAYEEHTPSIINGLDLKIRRGKVTAIVGPSGCGKSTLFKLLERLYEPNTGEIRILGVSQSSMSNHDIHKAFALIAQDTDLFDGTIIDNLLLGSTHLSVLEAQNILKRVALSNLPIETQVGERGSKLSGGQKQRVAIARALLWDAPIYLLDEATSALDVDTEKIILDTINHTLVNKTIICIAHRLSTITNADEILYMENGRIMERGKHAQLMAIQGGYWRLVQAKHIPK